jgi:hypothetical protein
LSKGHYKKYLYICNKKALIVIKVFLTFVDIQNMIEYVSQEGFYTLNIKRLFLYVIACGIFAFGGINSAMAATYNVIYDCNATDGGTGTAPDTETVTGGEDFTPATNTCTPPNGKHFSGWLIDGTNDILPAGVPMTYNYGNGINLIAQYTAGKFSIITTNLSQGTTGLTLKFYMSASGNFTVDCGSDGTLAGTDVSGTTITRTTTTEDEYTCTYTTGGIKTITFDGTADGYNTSTNVAAIAFYQWHLMNSTTTTRFYDNNTYIASINGNLSNIFPYLGDSDGQRPIFSKTFYKCVNLTSIPSELFSGFTNVTNASYMFRETFSYCTGLQTIPENLFSAFINVTNAQNMFFFTFLNCTGLQTTPENLFFSLGRTENAEGMFYGTFSGCTGLTSIPKELFSAFENVEYAPNMFSSTFYNCTSLESIDKDLFSAFTNVTNATSMFNSTFYNCTSLTSIDNMFTAFENVEDATYMFGSTFSNCTSLESIDKDLFSAFENVEDAYYMFYNTFRGCTGLTSIPSELFDKISVADAYTFQSTFSGCTGLTSLPDSLFAKITNVTTMTSNGNLVCNAFEGTFSGCTGLSGYIPPTFFKGLIDNNVEYKPDMMKDIFANTGLDTSCSGDTTRYETPYDSYWDGHVSCTPAHVVDYNCGDGTAPTPANQNTGEYLNFTVAQNTCTAPNNQHFTGWLISDSDNTIVQPGDAFQYLYTTNKTLTAQWENDVINIFLNWFNDNTQLDVPATSQTCEYGGGITLPEPNPSKPGYAFRGWRVRPRFDMTTLSAAEPSGDWMSKGFIYGDNQQFCDVNEEGTTCDDPRLADLSNGEWSVSFGADGTIKGIARCSKTAGETNGLWNNGYNVFPENIRTDVSDDLNETGAKYCWCRASGHAESGSNNYQSVASPAWVFYVDDRLAGYCTRYCAGYCARGVFDYSAFRRAIFLGQ